MEVIPFASLQQHEFNLVYLILRVQIISLFRLLVKAILSKRVLHYAFMFDIFVASNRRSIPFSSLFSSSIFTQDLI